MHTWIELKGEQYEVLRYEHPFILHPIVFGMNSKERDGSFANVELQLSLDNYKLVLRQMELESTEHIPVLYSGAILMAKTLVNDYGMDPNVEESYPCYCYKEVYEYVFEKGVLVTTIDHSRSMIRIRKNIDLGYRDLTKKRDVKCIQQYLRTSFVGRYKKAYNKKKTLAYVRKMKELYQDYCSLRLEIAEKSKV